MFGVRDINNARHVKKDIAGGNANSMPGRITVGLLFAGRWKKKLIISIITEVALKYEM